MSGRWSLHSELRTLDHLFTHSNQPIYLSVCLSTISLAVREVSLGLCYVGPGNGAKSRVLAEVLLGRVPITQHPRVILRTLLSEFLGLEGSPTSCSQAPSQREGNPQSAARTPGGRGIPCSKTPLSAQRAPLACTFMKCKVSVGPERRAL